MIVLLLTTAPPVLRGIFYAGLSASLKTVGRVDKGSCVIRELSFMGLVPIAKERRCVMVKIMTVMS